MLLSPKIGHAGFFSFMSDMLSGDNAEEKDSIHNSQNLPLLQASPVLDPNAARGGGDIVIVENRALLPDAGPLGTAADMNDAVQTDQIANYVVRKGDTVQAIAKMYGVTVNTIYWANDLPKGSTLKEGQTLVILPVSGVTYSIKKGDTLKGISKKYKADIKEIGAFNGITEDTVLAIGQEIIIPDGEISSDLSGHSTAPAVPSRVAKLRNAGGPEYKGYYIWPVVDSLGYRSQDLHGHNGIDIGGVPSGTALVAAAEGTVIIARNSGNNGGYGRYVVIDHANGTQTLYGHMSKVTVEIGQHVGKGQMIGNLGNTGRSTGPHVHFEVRGARNPFSGDLAALN